MMPFLCVYIYSFFTPVPVSVCGWVWIEDVKIYTCDFMVC